MSSQQILLGSGAAAADRVYVDDVFSTYLYTGTGSSRSITNGIDLSGEGGMVWIKNRDTGSSQHTMMDTERGAGKQIHSDDYMAQGSGRTDLLSSFNSNGFSIGGGDRYTNDTNDTYASYSFRKQEKFFNIITWTGDENAGRQISHGLGSVPGCIMVKCTSHAHNWQVWHRDLTGGTSSAKMLILNNTDEEADGSWNSNINVGATTFTVGSGNDTNSNNKTYVGYIFAHNEQEFGPDSDESIIYCGTYTGNGNATGPIINIGWEPQWLLIKRIDTSGGQWLLADTMRGIVSGTNEDVFYAHNHDVETNYEYLEVNGTGFQLTSTSGDVNDSSKDYIYIAIRRPAGAGKPPDAGTDVFTMVMSNGSVYNSGFPVDFAFYRKPTASNDWWTVGRLIQGKELKANSSDAESSWGGATFDSNDSWGTSVQDNTHQSWMWKRHAGFDVVTYKGTGSIQTIAHSLGVAPEFIVIKNRSSNVNTNAYAEWIAWHKDLTSGGYSNIPSTNVFTELSTTEGVGTGNWFNATAPTSSVVTLGVNGNKWDVRHNQSGDSYLMLLFSSVAGICKVGSYDGQDSEKTITTGFQPRFVIIKRTNGGTGSWYVLDTVRGWGSGDDKDIKLNMNNAQQDYDIGAPTSTGFTLTVDSAWNASGGNKYIYYAHA